MANRFFNPDEQFCDSTGLPYAGGSLAFYASGTSTPLNTYSDSALTIANTNPVVLDSAGRSGSIFLQNLAYKVVLSDVNAVQIWTEDPVYASDYSTRAKLTTGSGSPNGNTAGTAGSAGIGADTYWDNANNILYVCTQTGNVGSAVWTAVNSASAAAIVPTPDGYLTPTSGTPIITSDVIAATSLVYTPYMGNLIPIYTGTGFSPQTFTELTLTLTSSQAANTIYDVFMFNNSGVLTLVTGPAWASSTAGSCSRGSGAGTTQLSRLSGIWVNTVSMTGRNSSSTYTIPANQATYLGSILIDSTPGQITLHRSYGQSRKWAIWNAYNRVPIILKAGDSTANWSYVTNTIRAANGSSANSLTFFCGLPEEQGSFSYASTNIPVAFGSAQSAGGQVGIGFNSTTAFSGKTGWGSFSQGTSTIALTFNFSLNASYTTVPLLGINTITALESGLGSTVSNWQGSEQFCLLSGQWRG